MLNNKFSRAEAIASIQRIHAPHHTRIVIHLSSQRPVYISFRSCRQRYQADNRRAISEVERERSVAERKSRRAPLPKTVAKMRWARTSGPNRRREGTTSCRSRRIERREDRARSDADGKRRTGENGAEVEGEGPGGKRGDRMSRVDHHQSTNGRRATIQPSFLARDSISSKPRSKTRSTNDRTSLPIAIRGWLSMTRRHLQISTILPRWWTD